MMSFQNWSSRPEFCLAGWDKDGVFLSSSRPAPTPSRFMAPRHDGIHVAYYQNYWKIVGNSVFDIANDFFQNFSSLSSINHTNIVLIHKVENHETISYFRPISLCNVVYKVISNVMANSLRLVLKDCISNNQGAFAPGRSIMDNILIAD